MRNCFNGGSEGEEEPMQRAQHVDAWISLGPARLEGRLTVTQDVLVKVVAKLEKGKGSLDGCPAEVYALLESSNKAWQQSCSNFWVRSRSREPACLERNLGPKCLAHRGLKEY